MHLVLNASMHYFNNLKCYLDDYLPLKFYLSIKYIIKVDNRLLYNFRQCAIQENIKGNTTISEQSFENRLIRQHLIIHKWENISFYIDLILDIIEECAL